MIMTVFYVILAIFGLSFLIFIHELGHYWMARRVGMRVDVFSIGFGRPIYSWMRDGCKWKIGWIIFGGYVKISGSEAEEAVDPYNVPDGFYGKSPWDRIKVAFMGPFVNLVFAALVFALLWVGGGREKNFSELTSRIGWVDPNSQLFASGIRPGDEITAYDGYAFQTAKDHLYASMLASGDVRVKGFEVNYETGQRAPFELLIKPYQNPFSLNKDVLTLGIFSPASYMIYERLPSGSDNPLPEGSPLRDSGIQYGDRIVWVDGEFIFSKMELSEVLNDNRVLLTVKRGEDHFQRRVPRVQVRELRPDAEFREELIDWQHEAGLQNVRFMDLFTIPYNLNVSCVVENRLKFVDQADQERAFPQHLFSEQYRPLQAGDKIIAVQGMPVSHSYELLKDMQTKRVQVIIEREPKILEVLPSDEADATFNQNINWDHLAKMAQSIGTQKLIPSLGNLRLLKPVTPKIRTEFPMSEEAKAWLAMESKEKRKVIEQLEDLERRSHLLKIIDTSENQLVLGLPDPQDRKVNYNPKPTALFVSTCREIWRTLEALFSGTIGPKAIVGPVGIVQVVESTSRVSMKESFFWMGVISLNLGILNLLPIPMLDGGTILFSLFEMVTKRRLNPKTMEKITVVFAVLLISFFVFLTYNDLMRLFGRFVVW